jgi:hypothetical protein
VPDGDERDLRVRAHIREVWGGPEPPPTDTYVGLTLVEAHALADREGRRVVVRAPSGGRRRNLVNNRVNVVLDAGGVVVAADLG